MKNLGAKIEGLRPLREAKKEGRVEKSKLKWKRRELSGKASKSR